MMVSDYMCNDDCHKKAKIMSCAKRLESNKGFTLIEIVTVIVVLGILSVFTFSFID